MSTVLRTWPCLVRAAWHRRTAGQLTCTRRVSFIALLGERHALARGRAVEKWFLRTLKKIFLLKFLRPGKNFRQRASPARNIRRKPRVLRAAWLKARTDLLTNVNRPVLMLPPCSICRSSLVRNRVATPPVTLRVTLGAERYTEYLETRCTCRDRPFDSLIPSSESGRRRSPCTVSWWSAPIDVIVHLVLLAQRLITQSPLEHRAAARITVPTGHVPVPTLPSTVSVLPLPWATLPCVPLSPLLRL